MVHPSQKLALTLFSFPKLNPSYPAVNNHRNCFRLISDNRWVGWSNETTKPPGQPLELTFEFDGAREFTALHLHANNIISRSVQVSLI